MADNIRPRCSTLGAIRSLRATPEPRERRLLVGVHQQDVAPDVRHEDRHQPAFDPPSTQTTPRAAADARPSRSSALLLSLLRTQKPINRSALSFRSRGDRLTEPRRDNVLNLTVSFVLPDSRLAKDLERVVTAFDDMEIGPGGEPVDDRT